MNDIPTLLHIQIGNQSIHNWLKKNAYIIFSELIRYSEKMIQQNIPVTQAIMVENTFDNIVFIIKKESIKNMLDNAMEYFLEIEEYEKCSEIRDLLNKL